MIIEMFFNSLKFSFSQCHVLVVKLICLGTQGDHNGCLGYPIVVIPDVESHVLELILAFMYKGEITVPSPLVLPLIEAARNVTID